MTSLILAVALAVGAAAAPDLGPTPGPTVQGGVLSLSCMEALVAIGRPSLAGVFSFISDMTLFASFSDRNCSVLFDIMISYFSLNSNLAMS